MINILVSLSAKFTDVPYVRERMSLTLQMPGHPMAYKHSTICHFTTLRAAQKARNGAQIVLVGVPKTGQVTHSVLVDRNNKVLHDSASGEFNSNGRYTKDGKIMSLELSRFTLEEVAA